MMRRTMGIAACLAMLLPASLAWGQAAEQATQNQATQNQAAEQAGQNQTRRADRGANRRDNAARNVSQLATVLALGNIAEIEVSQLAVQQTDNDAVREYANKMIQDHTNYLQKLRLFNPQLTANRGAERAQASLLPVLQQAAAIKLGMTKQTLSNYQGQNFNMAFLTQQVYAHMEMLAHLQAMQQAGGTEFQEVVSQGIEATKQHLQLAKQLAKQFEDRERGTQDSATGTNRAGQ